MFPRSLRPRPRRGLSRIETIVVFLVLDTASALLLPACYKVRGPDARTSSTNNMKRLCLPALSSIQRAAAAIVFGPGKSSSLRK